MITQLNYRTIPGGVRITDRLGKYVGKISLQLVDRELQWTVVMDGTREDIVWRSQEAAELYATAIFYDRGN